MKKAVLELISEEDFQKYELIKEEEKLLDDQVQAHRRIIMGLLDQKKDLITRRNTILKKYSELVF